jgi:transcriptional regulator with XRE-family HTH domain
MHPIREARKAQGRSIHEVADAIGMDPTYLSKAERGRVGFTTKRLYQLGQVLGLDDLVRVLEPFIRAKESA